VRWGDCESKQDLERTVDRRQEGRIQFPILLVCDTIQSSVITMQLDLRVRSSRGCLMFYTIEGSDFRQKAGIHHND
jgi:hypothetical protein